MDVHRRSSFTREYVVNNEAVYASLFNTNFVYCNYLKKRFQRAGLMSWAFSLSHPKREAPFLRNNSLKGYYYELQRYEIICTYIVDLKVYSLTCLFSRTGTEQ